MPSKNPKKVTANGGVISDLVLNLKLVFRLLRDRRVSPFLKVLPLFSLLYLLNPLDIPGPFDDAGVIWLFLYIFIELCPPEVVAEHRAALLNVIPGEWRDGSRDDIIEGEFHEVGKPEDNDR